MRIPRNHEEVHQQFELALENARRAREMERIVWAKFEALLASSYFALRTMIESIRHALANRP